MFITGILKGMWVTIRTVLFKKNVTFQYPKEKKKDRPYRGLHKLEADKCIMCNLCAINCPINIIKIKLKQGREKTRNANDYDFIIDIGSCMWCGLCEEACPKQAILLTNTYEMADYHRDKLIKKL